MKKIITVICLISVFSTLLVSAAADFELDLPCVPSEISVNIDGDNSEDVWKEAAGISLTKENTGTWANMDNQDDILPVDAYFMWCEDGIYVFADVKDNNPVYDGANDCFEVSFNPGGIIPKEDDLQGMFFMFWPFDDDSVKCTRHNMSEETKGGEIAHDVQAKHKKTDDGWTIEALIPWHYICDETREVYVNKRKTEPLLADFDIKEGAFLTATVCRLNGDEDTQYLAVYRTCTDNIGHNFNTDSYNVKMNLGKELPVPQTDAVTESSTDTEVQNNEGNDGISATTVIVVIVAIVAVLTVVAIVLIKKRKV